MEWMGAFSYYYQQYSDEIVARNGFLRGLDQEYHDV